MGFRNYNLDLLRFVSALIVFGGHLFFGANHEISSNIQSCMTSVFKLGSFFVLVFFYLSGIALRYQTDKYGISLRWLSARMIRLMPMYWATLTVSLLGALYFGAVIQYPDFAYPLAFLGLESLIPSISIPPGNPPLWSLSVELVLSLTLLLFARPTVVKHKTKFIILIVMIIFLFPSYQILSSSLFFYSGFLFTIPNKLKKLSDLPFVFMLISSILILFFFSQTYFSVPNKFLNLLTSYVLAAALILPLLKFTSVQFSLITTISERAYSLYAVHFPVIVVIDSAIFNDTSGLSFLQFALSVFLVSLFTEVAFRVIEEPSIRYSRKILRGVKDFKQ